MTKSQRNILYKVYAYAETKGLIQLCAVLSKMNSRIEISFESHHPNAKHVLTDSLQLTKNYRAAAGRGSCSIEQGMKKKIIHITQTI